MDGLPVGKHPIVTRIMGIHNFRPPMPKYTSTWDVGMVTSYLKGLGPNDKLKLKQLSGKLVMLMALVEASRSSELAALDFRFCVARPEGVTFKLPSLTKRRNPGTPPKELLFGAFVEDPDLCIVKSLEAYKKATQDFRPQAPASPNKLFISHTSR